MPVSHAKTCSDCCVRSLKYALVCCFRKTRKQATGIPSMSGSYSVLPILLSALLPIQAHGRVSGIVLRWKRKCAHGESRLYCVLFLLKVQLDY